MDKYQWGTNLAYMVSGSYSLPQKDVMEALEIDRYSLSGIINHLSKIDKLEVSKYEFHSTINSCIIVGGGNSVSSHIMAIKEFLSLSSDTVLIHSTSKFIGLFEDIKNKQLFAVSGDELLKIDDTVKSISQYILEPSPRKINITVENKDDFYELKNINFTNKNFDSPLTISLQIGLEMDAKNIYLIGYDGYSELKNKKELYLMQENQMIIDDFISKNNLESLTPTKYKDISCISVYGMID